ncbi:MAG: signal peptidase I [Balneolaceae bacterium]|nr:signal peptidase I [Balneolaceae bacterium]
MSKEVAESNEEKRTRRKERRDRQQEQAKHWAREWLDALVFAAVAALIIRTFFFEAYRIPTPSMEETLLTGDFLVVSKISYGPRTPMVIGVPFTNIYLPGVDLPWTRIPGLTDVDRNDIVVFNYPIDIAPIAAKTNYIKRCVAIPGDTLSVRDKMVYINGELSEQFAGVQKNYVVEVRERVRLSPTKVQNAGGTLLGSQGQNSYRVNMTSSVAETIREWPEVENVMLHILPEDFNEFARRDFSFSSGFMNHDHLPPIVIPFEGQQVTLNRDNWHIYENIITRYERNDAEWRGDQLYINGEPDSTYTIRQDYYFMMGDNRDDSEDSRYWGFVPQDHVVGKAGMIYFSWDSDRWLPRFSRIFNFIHD